MSDQRTGTEAISVADLAAHIEKGDAFVVDVRGSKGRSQIRGAIAYDPKKLKDAVRLVLPLPKSDGLIVLYDDDGTSRDLEALAAKLRDDGYATVRILDGGFTAWRDAGHATEDPTLEQPVPLVSTQQLDR